MVMDKNKLIKFLVYTFIFTYLFWGIIIVASRIGLFKFDSPLGAFLYIGGTWMPTIFAYIYLKQNKTAPTVKSFLKIAFSFKATPKQYVLPFVFLAVLYIPPIIFSKTNMDIPWYLWVAVFPLMILDGGMEEIGWRYLVQPTLEKKFSFSIATTITAFIWWAWHLPMFFIPGSGQSQMSLMLFALFVFGQSFSLASIFQASKNVWLCIMYHALINTLSMYWPIADNLQATLMSSIGAVVLSLTIFYVKKKQSEIRIK